MTWTAERIETLEAMWRAGKSSGQIAAALEITRNAAIGKIRRLGLMKLERTNTSARDTTSIHFKPPPKPTPAPRALSAAVVHNIEEAPEVVISKTHRVTIHDLRESMCKWPIGDPSKTSFRYCGAAKEDATGVYCRAHALIAYVPKQDKFKSNARAAK